MGMATNFSNIFVPNVMFTRFCYSNFTIQVMVEQLRSALNFLPKLKDVKVMKQQMIKC
jgi:hypothetical protein